MSLEAPEDKKAGPVRLEVSFQSLEWAAVRRYLVARRNRLFDQLAGEKDTNEMLRVQGRIREIEDCLEQERLPAPLNHSKGSAY